MIKQRVQKKSPVRRILSGLVTGICVFVLVAGSAYLIGVRLNEKNIAAKNDDIRSLYHMNGNVASAEATQQQSGSLLEEILVDDSEAVVVTTTAAPSPFDMPMIVDEPIPQPTLQPAFAVLQEQNPDTIGWITTGFNVDLPILYRDNSFYLDHDFDGNYSNAGSIFLDQRNVKEMTDDMLLIYGHNMRSGAMFGDLDGYRQASAVANEPFITIQSAWEEEPRDYVFFSMLDASMNRSNKNYLKITHFNFETKEDKQAHIDQVVRRSLFKIPVDVNADDQLVVLVTCSYSTDNGRFLLYGRKLRPGETMESIKEQLATMAG